MLDYDRFLGMNRKYGAVRIQTIKHMPVTFRFMQVTKDQDLEDELGRRMSFNSVMK